MNRRSEEQTSELQSPVHLLGLSFFPTRRSSDLFPSLSSLMDCLCGSCANDAAENCKKLASLLLLSLPFLPLYLASFFLTFQLLLRLFAGRILYLRMHEPQIGRANV